MNKASALFGTLCVSLILPTVIFAETEVTAYFSNDSMNGFQLSDAYETHNMGLLFENKHYYAKLDLGIVTPDMYEYRNQYRNANRAYGELIAIELGQNSEPDKFSTYARIIASGEFGIDELQDFAHKTLSLQKVNKVNNLIRMPNEIWFGLGSRFKQELSNTVFGNSTLTYDGYLGSDSVKLQIDMSWLHKHRNYDLNYKLGIKGVAFDRIVSAQPINASERHLVPFGTFALNFELLGYNLFVSETISLPTISSDDRPYAVFNAGMNFKF